MKDLYVQETFLLPLLLQKEVGFISSVSRGQETLWVEILWVNSLHTGQATAAGAHLRGPSEVNAFR